MRALTRVMMVLAGIVLVALIGAYAAYWGWRAADETRWTRTITDGNPANAPRIAMANGCGGCHVISGVPGARGLVGPPLTGLAGRVYIAGEINNTSDNLIHWIRDARAMKPHTAMPSTLIAEQDARDLAAYLYTLH